MDRVEKVREAMRQEGIEPDYSEYETEMIRHALRISEIADDWKEFEKAYDNQLAQND